MTLDDALKELARRKPLTLNAELQHPVNGKPMTLRFADDHEFVVAVPAWVFRVILQSQGQS